MAEIRNDEIAELEDQIDQLKARIIVLKLENAALVNKDFRVPITDYIGSEITFVPQYNAIVSAVCRIAEERGFIRVETEADCFVVELDV